MTTKRQQLAKLRAVLGPEAAALAALSYPTPERETEAEALIRERQETERTQAALAMRETRDAVLAGRYGKEAAAKARDKAITYGRESNEMLEYCSKLANQVRKSAHYRNLALERKHVP